MQVLMNGLYNKFTGSTGADSLYALLGGRLHPTEAPQGNAYPYGVYHLISDVPEYTFNETIENAIIQFNLFDDNNSAMNINTEFTALTTLYDWSNINMSTGGYTSIYMKRELSYLIREFDVWNYMIQYRLVFQKN
jgi:hypothetical protein